MLLFCDREDWSASGLRLFRLRACGEDFVGATALVVSIVDRHTRESTIDVLRAMKFLRFVNCNGDIYKYTVSSRAR